MEGRMKKYRPDVSPERAKVWTEKSPKYHQQSRKVPVVYYLCRNRQLEHPHFIEVSLSSPDGLYLKDVIEKLNGLRGRGMASMYSWSCKRSYKNGFVWHDLCEDDLILPAHGSEYVLKGSELFEDSNSGRFISAGIMRSPNNIKQSPEPQEPAFSRSQEDSSSSTSMSEREMKHSQDDDLSPPVVHSGSSDISPESRAGKQSPCASSLSLTKYKVYKSDGLADASTQTEEIARANSARRTCTRGVSTDEGSLECSSTNTDQNKVLCEKVTSEIQREPTSPPTPSLSSATSSGGRTDTLEALIRADASKMNSFRILEEEEYQVPSHAKLKASNMFMQLISCGSISVKDHSFGLIPSYKPRFSDSKFQSPLFSTSVMLGELDCLADNPRYMGLRLEDKEYFSGSLVETNITKEECVASLKRSSSYNADRTSNNDSPFDKEEPTTRLKCIPLSIKSSLSKHPKHESMKSPASDGPRISSDGAHSSRIMSTPLSTGSSKRITEPSSGKSQSERINSFKDEKENVVKIEESLLQELGL